MKSRYEDTLRVWSWIVLIVGIIGSVILAYKFGVKVEDLSGKYFTHFETVRDWGLTIAIVLGGTFPSVILSVIFKGMAEILESTSELDYHMRKLNKKYDDNNN